MGRLFEAYRAARAAPVEPEGGAPEDLERTLTLLCERGRAAHPSFELDDATFTAHLGRSGAEVGGDATTLHAEDLYLACACLAGDPTALVHARSTLRSTLTRYVSRVSGARDHVDEVEQRLWEALLFGTSSGGKLVSYTGQGALANWVGVSAVRIALMMFRHEQAESRARDEEAARDGLASSDPELEAIRAQFREHFHGAVKAALDTMDDREKTLYRLHLVEGLTLERIGKAYSVSTSTVSRWLANARARVVAEARRLLSEKVTVSSGEFESITRMLVSQVDVNISQLLGKAP
jgi:RNA polymerase sigma-70 factor (ECF subfamily)